MKVPHEEVCVVPFSPDAMFDLVSDVASYPDFLPWCQSVEIISRHENPDDAEGSILIVDLNVGYKSFSEIFRSKVFLYKKKREIVTEYISGPFKFLHNRWHFEEIEEEGKVKTRVHFFIDFAFKNMLFQMLMGHFFEKAFIKMFEAFEKRAFDLYDV